MSLSKKERRLTIGVGLTIGIVCSSMLVRYAMNQKDLRSAQRPGNYESGRTAQDQSIFPPLPKEVIQSVRNGIVVYFDCNQSVKNPPLESCRSWVLETTGSFRSERLFVLVEQSTESVNSIEYFRASELYLTVAKGKTEREMSQALDQSEYRIIGKNSKTEELILQIKKFSPKDIKNTLVDLPAKIPLIESIRAVRWAPSR